MIRLFLIPLLVLALGHAAPSRAQEVIAGLPGWMARGFAPVAEAAAPAVVNIYAKRVVSQRTRLSQDPFFRDFFRDFGPPRPRVQNSLGSGVILSADGYVVSNYHVVGQATDIRVVLSDRREYSAAVVLGDEESDLAILRLDTGGDLPFLDLRPSDELAVGELVLAIGNPFGVGQTVSSGIVSGLARSGVATGNARGYFIQTDAPINPGNSGGALVDMGGRLIGVNTAILTRSGGSNGIGFAIPADLVAEFLSQARAGQTAFRRPWAGMTGQPVDPEMAETLQLDRPGGVIVSDLHPLSPFAAAGFLPGDVVLSVNGEDVNSPAEMLYRMSVAGLGRDAEITLSRNGDITRTKVPMIAAPETPDRATKVLGDGSVLPGLTLERANPAAISEYGLALNETGVVVADPGPYGARAGLARGDVIEAVNGAAILHPRDAGRALRAGQGLLQLQVRRGSRRVLVRLRG